MVVKYSGMGTQTEGVWNQGARGNIEPLREEVTGPQRRQQSEELCDLCCSPRIIRMMMWVRNVSHMAVNRDIYKLLVRGKYLQDRAHVEYLSMIMLKYKLER
jgi:hypothetical protein